MADLTQTPANVAADADASQEVVTAGEAVDAGMPVYKKASDSKWYKARNDNTAEVSGVSGVRIALNSTPGANQPLSTFIKGKVNLGATLTVGETYMLSNTAGKVAPIGDLATNRYVTILGVAISASQMNSVMFASNTQKA